MKNKKGYTIVEVIISFSLIMVVLMYLFRTIIVVSNKNTQMTTMQEYQVYETNLLNSMYKDFEEIYEEKNFTGISQSQNKITFNNLDKSLEIKKSDDSDSLIYGDTIYELPDKVKLREKTSGSGIYYEVNEVTKLQEVYIINIYVKVYDKNDVIKIVYQNKYIRSYTITFDDTQGNLTYYKRKRNERLGTLPEANPPVGKAFTGWRENGATEDVTEDTKVTKDVTYYAQFTNDTYKIIFNANGGTGTMNSQSIPRGSTTKKIAANTFTRTGYDFTGWNTKANGSGTAYTDKQKITQNMTTGSQITLYAQWSAKQIVVTYMRNKSSTDTTYKSQRFTYGSASKKFGKKDNTDDCYFSSGCSGDFANWTKTGYTFLGWSKSKSATSKTYDPYWSVQNAWINNNSPEITIYGVWKVNTYTITANANGGSIPSTSGWTGTGSKATKSINYGSTYGTLPTPTKAGYTFMGWYSDNSQTFDSTYYHNKYSDLENTFGSNRYRLTLHWLDYGLNEGRLGNSSSITPSLTYKNESNQTIYAKWERVVTVNFYRNNDSSDTGVVKEKFIKGLSNQHFGKNTDNTCKYTNCSTNGFGNWVRTGYNFLGWSETRTSTSNQYSAYNELSDNWIENKSPSVNLYGIWSPIKYNITFNGNGSTGGGTTPMYNIKYNESKTLSTNGFVRNGFTFIGWATSASGSVAYGNGASIKNLTSTDNATITLYAKWQQNDSGGGDSGGGSGCTVTCSSWRSYGGSCYFRTNSKNCNGTLGNYSGSSYGRYTHACMADNVSETGSSYWSCVGHEVYRSCSCN